MVVATGCPLPLSSLLVCFCLAKFYHSSEVLVYPESLFTVVWDVFESLECLGGFLFFCCHTG